MQPIQLSSTFVSRIQDADSFEFFALLDENLLVNYFRTIFSGKMLSTILFSTSADSLTDVQLKLLDLQQW
jgi:hypothetical protein